MRLARLLLMALVVLIAGRTVAGQEVSIPQQPPQVATPKPDYVRPFVRVHPARGAKTFYLDDLRGGPDFCLTMHTLVVAREDGGDSTHLVAHRTCTPARKFEMKSAVVRTTDQK